MMDKLSVSGRKWHYRTADDRTVLTMVQRHNIPEIIAKILCNRDVDCEQAINVLSPTLKTLLPDPALLLDMQAAVDRTIKAIDENQKIAFYADYDVDGATSSALLRRYFNSLGIETTLYIPDRIDEGYGANAAALQKLHDEGIQLVIMTDCGTTAFDPLAHAKTIGLDVIILDHHTAEPKLPEVAALVNPNRLDQDLSNCADLARLCAAGVSFMFLVGLQRELRKTRADLPDLMGLLDLVALGTVCDVMPLTGLNRAFVAQGLKVIQRRENLGLMSLGDVAGVTEKVSTYHLGFVIGPRINAGGRVGKADLGSRLLTTQAPAEAQQISRALDFYNKERQDIEKSVLEQAIGMVESEKLYENPVIMVCGDDWHPGVIGIVSGRLKEKYQKPTIVVTFDKDGSGKGSGRSVSGVELGSAMHVAVHEGLLEKGGGHAMAAGLSVHRSQYDAFYAFLNDRFREAMATYVPSLYVDASVPINALSPAFAKSFDVLEPFGNGNPSPKFAVQNVRPHYSSIVGEDHVSVTFKDSSGHQLRGIAFRALSTPLGDILQDKSKVIDLVGSIKHNVWNGREQVSFMIEDAMLAD